MPFRSIAPVVISILTVLSVRSAADETALREARTEFAHGRYEDAIRKYDGILEEGDAPPEAWIGKVRLLRETGKYDEVEEVLQSALADLPDDPDLLAEQADYLLFRGRWDECGRALERALDIDPEHLRAHTLAGELAEARGDISTAKNHFDRLFWYYNATVDSVTDPEELCLVGRAAEFFKAFHDANRVYNDAVKQDPEYLSALVDRGFLFVRTHSEPRARGLFQEALLVNPKHPEVNLGIAVSHLSAGDFPEAQEPLEKALEVNPNLPEALEANALIELYDMEYDKAREILEAALDVNPMDLEALGLAAFCERARGDRDAEKELEKRALAVRPKPVDFYNAAGEACAVKRWSAEAEEYFARALELAPDDPRALGNHGMVLMRLGREEEAAEVLDKAFERDRFDKRVYNFRIVLKEMKQFPVRETGHFEIKMPPDKDPVLGELLAEKAEAAFGEFSRELGFSPPVPVIFEVFENRGIFAARVTGLPRGIPTAICLGPVVAMQCPPSGEDEGRAFQWNHVLRHELAHVFTLAWTRNRVPRWYTEGISVYFEGSERVRYDPDLASALRSKRLLAIEDLNHGFTRPETPGQVGESYAQAGLVVRFIVERWGMETVKKLLDLFAEEKSTEDAIPQATGLSIEEFNAAMLEYLTRLVLEERRARPELDMSRLDYYHRRIERSPDDPEIQLRAAELHLAKEEYDEAREHAEEALNLDKGKAEALELLARIEHASGNEEEALEFARRALETGGERYYPHLVLGLVYAASGEKEKAIDEFEKAKEIRPRYVWPDNPYEKLAELYDETGRPDRALRVREEMLALREDDSDGNIELARAYIRDGTREEAIRILEKTLEIVPFNPQVHGTLGKALLDEGNDKEAARVLARAVRLAPKDALYQLDLATACARVGQGTEALEHATEALHLDPELDEARDLIEELGG